MKLYFIVLNGRPLLNRWALILWFCVLGGCLFEGALNRDNLVKQSVYRSGHGILVIYLWKLLHSDTPDNSQKLFSFFLIVIRCIERFSILIVNMYSICLWKFSRNLVKLSYTGLVNTWFQQQFCKTCILIIQKGSQNAPCLGVSWGQKKKK